MTVVHVGSSAIATSRELCSCLNRLSRHHEREHLIAYLCHGNTAALAIHRQTTLEENLRVVWRHLNIYRCIVVVTDSLEACLYLLRQSLVDINLQHTVAVGSSTDKIAFMQRQKEIFTFIMLILQTWPYAD